MKIPAYEGSQVSGHSNVVLVGNLFDLPVHFFRNQDPYEPCEKSFLHNQSFLLLDVFYIYLFYIFLVSFWGALSKIGEWFWELVFGMRFNLDASECFRSKLEGVRMLLGGWSLDLGVRQGGCHGSRRNI
jgi:hypothetical protein